ncbi:hypothetical protein F5Y00DRAFT_274569 [Daldinia vernicosa]|uniref:uncharacterized protein n=1 Tax=Daldinia vernicosa TaxID=114800 RepID=UPI002008B659|nr:uncharacterized protein F5Y00DRAFT_274569 [Daldinia vernicosa]KAI0851656.1 hypothetical protein F5Y00DRAFT_274569 [Daldinia vernicosa]
MTESWNLNPYKCTHPPKTLWRVIHSGTQSRRCPSTGDLIASDSTRIIRDEPELKQAIEKHINWWSRQPSCFLSVFSNRQHARNWAEQRGATQSRVDIYEIDTTRLPPDTYLFDVDSLKATLGFVHPASTHEFLFLHRIPARAIVSKRGLGEIWEKEAEARHYAARPFDPNYHWVPDLDGWYDSDEECEERNRCDDLINMIEGNWNWNV